MSKNFIEANLQEQLDFNILKKRSVTGVVAITSRTFFLQVVTFAATFLLTVFLSPQEYGVFFVVSAVVNFLVYFSDVGLAAALIQKKDQPTQEDFATTFTIQQALVISLVIISLLTSSFVARFYHLSSEGLWLFRSLVIAFFLSSLKTIPSVKLERRLEFNKLIIPQIVENVLFYTTAVILAWQGLGVKSFTAAVLVRGFSGLLVIYLLAPWKPRLNLKGSVARHLLSFGLPFQLNSLLALVKDDLLTAFLGKILPLSQVGFLGWAQRWALFPLRMFMDSINKVTFPTYSRLQDKKQALKRAIEKSIFFVGLFIFPILLGMVATAPAFIRLIPRYLKWQPALIALTLFSLNSLWSSISTTLTNTLAAVGKIKLNLKLMVMWTGLTWVLTPFLVFKIGYNGAALASALVAFTSIIPIVLVKKIIHIRVVQNLLASLISALIMAISVFFLSSQANSLPQLGLVIAGGAILYGALTLLLQGKKTKQEITRVIQLITTS